MFFEVRVVGTFFDAAFASEWAVLESGAEVDHVFAEGEEAVVVASEFRVVEDVVFDRDEPRPRSTAV